MSIGTTLLLSAVAIKFVVAPSLPKVSYLTGIDLDTGMIYGFIVIVIVCQAYLPDYDEELRNISFKASLIVLAILWRTLFVIMWRYFTRGSRLKETVVDHHRPSQVPAIPVRPTAKKDDDSETDSTTEPVSLV
jgi:hypothetical protein